MTDPADREPGPRRLVAFAVLGTATALALSLPTRLAPFLSGLLVNPDSTLRLVRIEEQRRTGHAVDLIRRLASGHGAVLHWSHLLDALLLALAAPLAPLLGWHGALFVAASLSGPLSLGLLGAALAWAAAPFAADRAWLRVVPPLAAASPVDFAYGQLGCAHHHILLLALLALVCGHVARAASPTHEPPVALLHAARAGIAGGAGIWLTPEALPLLLPCLAPLVLLWLCRPSARLASAMLMLAGSFALTELAAWLVDPPQRRWSAALDRLSVVHVCFGVALLAAAFLLPRRHPRDLPDRAPAHRVAAPGLAALPLLLWLAAFPAVLAGPSSLVPGPDAKIFFAAIAEMRPVTNPQEAALYTLPALLALLAALALALADRRILWLHVAAAAAAAASLAAWHIRFAPLGACLACALAPVLLDRVAALRPAPLRVPARAAMLLALFAGPLVPSALATPRTRIAPPATAGCDVRPAYAFLARHAAAAIVLALPDQAPELLYRTQAVAVGSLYLRDIEGFLRDRAAWRSLPSQAVPAAVAATGAAYVLACPGSGPRPSLVADLPSRTLWDALASRHPPPWLTQVPGLPLYRLRR